MGLFFYYIKKRWILSSSLFLIIVYIILGLQGLPTADDSYALVAYQHYFSDPTSSYYLFDRYLTALIGGIWNELFGGGGHFCV